VFFGPNADNILTKSYPVLQGVVDVLLATPSIKKIGIEGHTDAGGKFASNLDLSERRAKSVLRWLVSRGISPDRLEAKGYGPTRPVSTNKTNAGRAKNRRVEFHILDNSTTAPAAAPASPAPDKAPDKPADKPADKAGDKPAAVVSPAQDKPAAKPADKPDDLLMLDKPAAKPAEPAPVKSTEAAPAAPAEKRKGKPAATRKTGVSAL
jgi:hypothetical protein